MSKQLRAGIVDADTIKRYTFIGNRGIAMFPKLKMWGVSFLQNIPDVIDFDDFRKITLNAEGFHQSTNTLCVVDELFPDEQFLDVKGWWQVDSFSEHDRTHSLTFIILYNDDGAYEAVLDKWQEIPSIRAARDSNIFDRYGKYLFGGSIYYGNIHAGKYRAVLKVKSYDGKEYYFPLDEIINITA